MEIVVIKKKLEDRISVVKFFNTIEHVVGMGEKKSFTKV